MLYVNGELISTGNNNDTYLHKEVVMDYHSSIKDMKDYYGQFLTVETKIRPRTDGVGAVRNPGAKGLLLISNINRNNSDRTVSPEELRYSPSILQKNDGGNLIHESPNLLIHRGSYPIDINRNPDLAYYVWRCGKVGRTPAEGKKFHLYDIKATNKKVASTRRAEGQAIHMIYSAIPEDDLRILAKSWGLDAVDTTDIETVREMFFEKVQSGENERKRNPRARGFKAFAASSEVTSVNKLTALCKDAETDGKLKYSTEDRIWVIDYKDGGQPYTLKELSGDEFGDPLGALVNYLSSNSAALKKVHNVMGKVPKLDIPPKGKPVEDNKVVVPHMDAPMYTAEQILEEKSNMKLKAMLRKADPDGGPIPNTLKSEDVRKRLLEKLMQETQG